MTVPPEESSARIYATAYFSFPGDPVRGRYLIGVSWRAHTADDIIQTFSNPGTLVLSSGSSSTEAQVSGADPHIKLVDMGDAAVRLETGWCIRAIADYEIQFECKPSQAATAVEAIILGGAEEYVITDDDDRWVAFGWCIRGEDSLMSKPPHITTGRKAVRRLLPWRSV